MFHKASLSLVILILSTALLPFASGCGSGTVIDDMDEISIDLSLHPPPSLGETAELTFIATLNYWGERFDGVPHGKAWVEFYWTDINSSYSVAKKQVLVPAEEVVVSGETSWEGPQERGKPVELESVLRFHREGIWEIRGLAENEAVRRVEGSSVYHWRIRVAVTREAGGIMKNSTYGPELSYLDYFPYGGVGEHVLDEEHPVVLVLDVPKSPRVGEEVPVTCTIRSLEDKPDFSIKFGFRRGCWPQRTIPVPPEIVLVSGDLRWYGNLNKGEVIQFSINVRFPEVGDWSVGASGQSPGDDPWKYSDGIMFHISEEWAAFGWSLSDRNCPEYTTPRPSPLQSPLTRPE